MKPIQENRRLRPPSVKAAAVYAVYINVLLYLLSLILFIYERNVLPPYEGEPPHPHPDFSWWRMACFALSSYLFTFTLFCLNFYILRRERMKAVWKTATVVLASLAFITLWNYLSQFAYDAWTDIPVRDPRAKIGTFVMDLLLGSIVVFASQMVYLNHRRHLITTENEALKSQYERARYHTLKEQINPHFLFNTLNTLNSLIAKDPASARKYVQKLSSIFRYSIRDKEDTTVEQELQFTRDYSDLMQIRYGENLRFVFDTDPRFDSRYIVPLSVQTLVENAIKHNVISARHPLTITISTGGDGALTVSNPINPKQDTEPGEGIGLANLSERYRLKCGEDIVIRSDNGTFSVSLPLSGKEKTEHT